MGLTKSRLRSGSLYVMLTLSCLAPLFFGGGPIVPVVFLALVFIFLDPEKWSPANALLLLLPAGATSLAYSVFFKFSGFIWSKNKVVDPASLTPWIRDTYLQPRDGIEVYVAYVMVLTILLGTAIVYFSERRFLQNSFGRKVRLLLIVALVVASVSVLIQVKWYAPWPNILTDSRRLLVIFVSLCALWSFMAFEGWLSKFRYACLFVFLIPVCFVPISDGVSMLDFSFILDPALRLLSGVPVKDVYLQYDLFLSLLSMPFLALKLSPVFLRIVFQLSLYVLFAGIALYARKWMRHRTILIAMILSIVVVKIYGLMHDPSMIPQVTPLRLDWWLLPAVLICCFGMYHWSVGLALGFLIAFHKTFGVLYTLAYVQGVAVFYVFGLRGAIQKYGVAAGIRKSMLQMFQDVWKNALLMVVGVGLAILLYRRVGLSDAVGMYRDLGIGFDRISRISFFWYLPVLFGVVGLLIINNRTLTDRRYLTNGIFLILFAVANCTYFFGRSHEHNLINIASIVLVVLFMGIDLLFIHFEANYQGSNGIVKHALFVLPLVVLLYAAYYYSAPLVSKARLQVNKIMSASFVDMSAYDFDTELVRQVTKGSSKIFVLSLGDFPVYYDTNSTPPLYLSPYFAWIDKQGLVAKSQEFLDNGYYIVRQNLPGQPEERYISEIVEQLRFRHSVAADSYTVLFQ